MSSQVNYNGIWEQENRNPLLASFIIVLIWGSIYFFAGSLVVNIYVVIDFFVNKPGFSQDTFDYLELLKLYYSRYKYLVLILTGVSQYIFLLIFPIKMIKKWHTREISAYFQYNRFPPGRFLVALAGIITIIPVVDGISQFFDSLFPVFKKFSEVTSSLYTYSSPLDVLLLFLIICVTPAICEEALFRGYFQRTLQRKILFPWHFILSGFIFSLYHQQPLALPALFLVGCYLGFIYYATDSIYVSMAAHMIYNLLILLFYNMDISASFFFDANGSFQLWIVAASLVIFAGCCFMIYKSYKKTQAVNG